MKKILSIIASITILGCGSQNKISEVKNTNGINNIKDVEKKVSVSKVSLTPVLKEDVISSLEYLASDALEGRSTGSEGIEKAAVFIEDFFKENKVQPYYKTYRDSFNLKDIVGYNIVGYVEGHDPMLKNEFVILGAHYDHIGTAEPVNGDRIANGANDDASGTVAVLEWAKYFAKSKSNKRSILFTLYTAEEIGLKGSGHLAERLKSEALNLYTMINFEMVGVPRAENEIMAYITGYNKTNMAEKLNSYAKEDVVGFLPKAKAYNLFKRSDNYPFFNAFKIPAQAISTFDFTNFDYYHHVDDEADKMDFDHMTSFINKMIPALEGMINAETKEIKMNNE
ncbi:M20/M25/M40 family metallo-hydrolase [Flavivirga algicola]|uniref:M20/M25/M40 family metallo-hydrolase n=1 Tax=Flavivirga algicola TaxID=2729136 RepID=A0ABX1RUW1_9FLAO|nr:M20/M25/M40 family metallo-hydrolase [Flavivirga algicola]NMH87332.1 M20/M25/M40 family metallo-hydrolase [Flavivirga algicola]